jgi:hypothetical protein
MNEKLGKAGLPLEAIRFMQGDWANTVVGRGANIETKLGQDNAEILAVEVIEACQEQDTLYPRNTQHWTDNQCTFLWKLQKNEWIPNPVKNL